MAKALRNREGIMIEKSADELDEVERGVERDIAIHNLDRESRNFGTPCAASTKREPAHGLHCGDEISPKRLDAVPWTPFCLPCLEAADRGDEFLNQPGHGS